MLRFKFFSLLSGYVATQDECEALLKQDGTERRAAAHRVRPSKHNMAKGALKPEDAAVRMIPCVRWWLERTTDRSIGRDRRKDSSHCWTSEPRTLQTSGSRCQRSNKLRAHIPNLLFYTLLSN